MVSIQAAQVVPAAKPLLYNYKMVIIDGSGPQQPGFVSNTQPQYQAPRPNPVMELINQIITFTAITAGAGFIFRSAGRLKEHIIANGLHEQPLSKLSSAARTQFEKLIEFATNSSVTGKVNFGNLSLSDLTNPQKLKDIGAQTAEAIKDRFNSLFGTSTERISNDSFSQAVKDHSYSRVSENILRGLEKAGDDREKLRNFAESLSADLQRVSLDEHPKWESKIGNAFAQSGEVAKTYFNGSDTDVMLSKKNLKELALELHNIATSVVSNDLQSNLAADVVVKQIDDKDVSENLRSTVTQIFQSLFNGELKIGDIQERVASDFKGVKEGLQLKLAKLLVNTASKLIPTSA